ncbi:MAG: rhomboid family intramembrane serine protease [Sphingobacteriaceae bacterium]|nr:rhomboid family intramembrane serine protease [Cytophagaceae bacterium]
MSGFLDDFKGAFTKRENGLVQIILVNVIVFLTLLIAHVVLKLSKMDGYYELVVNQLELPASLPELAQRPWTLLTYFFTHEDPFHILFNMLFLYWFGRLVDEYLGNRRVVNLYLLGGIVGGIAYVAIYNLVPYFHERVAGSVMIGASGAAFAVVFGAATLLPNYSFHLLFFGPVRIKYIALFYLILSFAQSTGSNAGGNIAHLGGALLGFIFIKQLQRGSDLGKPLDGLTAFVRKLFKPKPRPSMKVTYRSQTKTTYTSMTPDGFPDDDEVDAILDKISKSGYESLTREEKQKLFKASQRN